MPVGAASPKARARIQDRKSTRLNSSHSQISYAVFCLKKKKKKQKTMHVDIEEYIKDSRQNGLLTAYDGARLTRVHVVSLQGRVIIGDYHETSLSGDRC